jgi:pimeloyl-ACP methyl ester carboxylesterase
MEHDRRLTGAARLSRSRLLGGLVVACATLLSGCRGPVVPGPDCDPPGVSGVDWIPDVAHPVAWGEEHLTAADGAPRTLSVYYPSPRFLPPRPMLRSCLARWPVVLFLHGQPPDGLSPANRANYHRAWFRVPVALARSGYVVVVPRHNAILPGAGNAPAAVAEAMRDIDFVRTQWSEAKWVAQGAGFTAVAGHSFGALLAARIAAAHPDIAAFVSLGGGYHQLDDRQALLNSIRAPSFFMFSSDGGQDFESFLLFERIDDDPSQANNLWPELAQDKYAATYDGGHFDYLEPAMSGSAPRSDCSLIGGVAADLVALFIASNVQSLTRVPVDLDKPTPPLTEAQQALAIQHLTSIDRIAQARGCRVNLKWRVDGLAGARTLGP